MKILYIKPANYSFALIDETILRNHFDVKSFLIAKKNDGLHFIWRILNMMTFVILRSFRAKMIITWFADYHAAVLVILGKILNIKVVIIAGGQEAVCYPELKKGVYYKKYRGKIAGFALRHADLILPNHESLVYHENFYYDPQGKKDGIRHYVPGLQTKITVITNGIDTKKFYRDIAVPKEPGHVLTVGTMSSVYDFINKGYDLFVAMARRNPDLKFTMVGIRRQFLPWIEQNYPFYDIPNLECIYFCPQEALFETYNRSEVFVQASITEGMPNTLCEAMLCGCIPVGSRVNGIPDVIGETGIIINQRDVSELESGVRKALTMSTGDKAASRIRENYSFRIREEKMAAALNELLIRKPGNANNSA